MSKILILIIVSTFTACTSYSSPVNSAYRPAPLAEQVPETTRRYFVDGLYGQVHLRVATPPKDIAAPKTPLILLPPAPYSSDYFKSFIPEMAKDRIVIAIDTPGFGDSDRPPEPPSISDFARNTKAVLDALGLTEPVDVLGYHTGTLIAAELAVQNPNRVRRLVLPGVPYFTGKAQAKLYAETAKPDTLSVDGTHLKSKWDFVTGALPFGLSLTRAQAHFSDAMQAMPESGYTYYGVFSYPGDQQFPKLTRPTLFIASAGSLRTATESAHAVTPDAEIIYLDQYSKGVFDIGVADMAAQARAFLDTE